MLQSRARVIAAVILVVLALPAAVWAQEVRVIVGFHGDCDAGVFDRHSGTAVDELDGAVVGLIPPGKLGDLRAEPGVAYVEEDLVRTATLTPNDTYYASYQADDYGLINCPEAWDVATGAGIRVAVLDTGCQLNHPDIGSGASGKIKISRNFTTGNPNNASDKNGHGTHTAGTVGARTNNGTGVAAAGYQCELAIGKVLSNSGSGYDSWIAAGIRWSWETAGAKVINMSLGGPGSSSTLTNAVNTAWSQGVILAAAAGNSGSSSPEYPAAIANCISVAATNSSGSLASFSNYGSTVDLAAPGVSIASTYKNSSYALGSGTSMAAPHVAGVAAIVWSAHTGEDNASIRARLERGNASQSVSTPSGSLPLLDAYASVVD